MKIFFGIKEEKYQFEIFDLTATLTFLNVALIILGQWYAPIFGLVNCVIFLTMSITKHGHINEYISQLALVILNFYFLKG